MKRDSSEKIVGGFGLRQFGKCVIEGEFQDSKSSEAIRFLTVTFALLFRPSATPGNLSGLFAL